MALTFAPTTRHVYSIGDRKQAVIDLGITGQPTATGDALTASALGFDVLDYVSPCGSVSLADGSLAFGVVIVHPATAYVTSVTVFLEVQGTAGAANPMIETTATLGAGQSVRIVVVGKGKAAGSAL